MRVLLLGHSLVQYFDWQGRFPDHLVWNRGVAGESTHGLLSRLDREVRNHPDADAVALMTGTNDLLMGDESYIGDCRRIAARVRKAFPRARIVLHGILPVSSRWAEMEALREANRRIGEIADDEDVEFLDLSGLFLDGEGCLRPGLLAEDGVHLSAEGYRLWSGSLASFLGLEDRG